MKNVVVFGLLFLFLFIGFRPPAGMRKLPSANIEFDVQTSNGTYSASLGNTTK